MVFRLTSVAGGVAGEFAASGEDGGIALGECGCCFGYGCGAGYCKWIHFISSYMVPIACNTLAGYIKVFLTRFPVAL